jgi:hypothetical protein
VKGEREAMVGVGVEVVERGEMTEEKESERVASGRERGWDWDCGFGVSSEVSWDGREVFGWSESMAREMERFVLCSPLLLRLGLDLVGGDGGLSD